MQQKNGANPNAIGKLTGNAKPARHTFNTRNICRRPKYTHFTGFGCLVLWNPNYYTWSM